MKNIPTEDLKWALEHSHDICRNSGKFNCLHADATGNLIDEIAEKLEEECAKAKEELNSPPELTAFYYGLHVGHSLHFVDRLKSKGDA